MACNCNNFEFIATGGASAGGVADVQPILGNGGTTVGGTARVFLTGEAYDGFAAIWPLDESGSGEIDEYQDRSGNDLHGIGGSGASEYTPSLDDGVFCLSSQSFDGRDFINVPKDSINGEFSVSMFFKVTSRFGEKVFFSRGLDSPTTSWNFALGTSYVNQLMCKIKTTEDVYRCFGSKLTVGNWHHVAATWHPVDGLKVYLDGVLSGSTATEGTVSYSGINNGYIGRLNSGKGFSGNVQEVRLLHVAENQSYFAAERSNFCNSGFTVTGPIEDVATA